MLKRSASSFLAISLLLTLAGPVAHAQTSPTQETKSSIIETPAAPVLVANSESQPNEDLKAGIAKLVSDAKAGKVTPRLRPQLRQPRNNLSLGVKIAIVAGIVLVVLAIIVYTQKDNLFDCESRCVL